MQRIVKKYACNKNLFILKFKVKSVYKRVIKIKWEEHWTIQFPNNVLLYNVFWYLDSGQ